jgi:hypothetical protein
MLAVAGVTAMAVIVFPALPPKPPHPRLNKDTESRTVKRTHLERATLEVFIIGKRSSTRVFRVKDRGSQVVLAHPKWAA